MSQCRFCQSSLQFEFVDLVSSPPSNAFLKAQDLLKSESYFPLKLYLCQECLLVQIDEYQDARELFNPEYAYFSSFSKSWLKHCEAYVQKVTEQFGLNSKSMVFEIASNDGYLLQYFKQRGIPQLGIEPTRSTASVAIQKGIPTEMVFFNDQTAKTLRNKYGPADLIAANNVLAHVPNLNEFVAGIKLALRDSGVATFEFPHLLRLVRENQFDTIYHEHFSYLSLLSTMRIMSHHGLRVFDVEEIPTHGGSLRLYVAHRDSAHEENPRVAALITKEKAEGMDRAEFYSGFQKAADRIRLDFWGFLTDAAKQNKSVAGYGAAAKGNTLLNFCGVKGTQFIQFVADASPHKQGLFLPGSHIPVVAPDKIYSQKPDYVVIFPWNLTAEVSEQLSGIREWGGKFVVAIPELRVF